MPLKERTTNTRTIRSILCNNNTEHCCACWNFQEHFHDTTSHTNVNIYDASIISNKTGAKWNDKGKNETIRYINSSVSVRSCTFQMKLDVILARYQTHRNTHKMLGSESNERNMYAPRFRSGEKTKENIINK